jgi:copper transport protein
MIFSKLLGGTSGTTKRAITLGSIIAIVALVGIPALLFAHAHLLRSEPAAGARVSAAPTALRLWFSERPEIAFTRIRLRAADSSDVPLGAIAAIAGGDMGITVPITGALAPGTYRVLWRTAAADGHATSGTFTFMVTASASVAASAGDTLAARAVEGHDLVRIDTTTELTTRISAIAATRWLEFIAMLAVVGAVVFRLAIVRGFERGASASGVPEVSSELVDSARRFGQSALVLLLVASVSRLYSEVNTVLGPPEQGKRPPLRTMLLGTSWGRGWLVGLIGILLAAAGFAIAKRSRSAAGWGIAALGAVGIVLAPALTGHAISTSPVALSVTLDVLHVAAVCAWLGGLLTLLLTAMPFIRGAGARSSLGSGQLVASLVRSFHPIALTCAATVVVTGVIAAWLRLPAWSDLWASTYGRVLLVKLCFVAVVVVLGATNWRRILPGLGDEASARRLTRTAGTELTIAALVLAATAVLVSTSPP